ncbi:bifunctional alpha,alpha-trehalose-phosphate synthase (UDP-forming)/trehalose-phosphatase [Candidatus Latescibacterota bacterium]
MLIVSNRLPVSVSKRGSSIIFKQSAGGLATGLGSLFKGSLEGKWIGWPGIPSNKLSVEQKNEIIEALEFDDNVPVFLTQSEIDNYYSGFSNRTIWPHFHYFTQYTVYNEKLWDSYIKVNRIFCDAVLENAEPGDIVWVHDYQLLLLPQMLREKMPELTIGFFLHIPFPSSEVFRILPWRREILEGLLGADLIGFHIYDYARHFLSSLRNRLGIEHEFGKIKIGTRLIKVDAFPMGIDYERFSDAGKSSAVITKMRKFKTRLIKQKIILSVDRLDYTKGIGGRLVAFDLFLEKHPEYCEKVTLILVAVPSRTKVEHYRQLKKDLDEKVGNINGKYSSIAWTPVLYIYDSLDFEELNALYNLADVCLVTPERDGMNLIAKEFIASKSDGMGVLILSEMAGAAKELTDAIIVNPNNVGRVVEAIYTALTIPEQEQIDRNRTMQEQLKRYNVSVWADDFMKQLMKIKSLENELLTRKMTQKLRKRIREDYRQSKSRLILLDYDGTLKDFEKQPQDAIPDKTILRLLIKLSGDKRNDIIIISGRSHETLDVWFKHLNIHIIAEHGVWIKEKGEDWVLPEPQENHWKDEIRPLLQWYRDRTPGSLIEEKSYSIAWHYRRTEPGLGIQRSMELKEEVIHFTSNLGIGVLEGNKVIEVKNIGINKGNAALKWINNEMYDFVFAAGDDRTDEDLFQVLPDSAYSIKVGILPTIAKFSISSVSELRSLLSYISKV